jgi:nucleotide-binding universal stress UspA family protein
MARRSSRPVLMVRGLSHEPYRRVLVPVDFSAWSRDAIELARQVAPQAALVLMHAAEVPFEGKMRVAGVPEDTVRRYRDAAQREARERLHALAADAGLDPDQVRLSTPCGADPWMLIVQEEQEHDCDLVVIGRQGRHALDEFLLGSTTRMVLSDGAADVLVSTRRRV